ncbi:protein of unknown function (plasmid) [Methylocella tundrae]|uniref:Uncharacterized protein n=1 Tax=Methylocella tundrae TaxID=227605 RepID=A0A4U8Z7C8_METTU|nr:protein of unknown function [Methylocella tundrae]
MPADRTRTTGTPRPGTIWRRGRSPGSRVVASVRPSRSRSASVTHGGLRLAAYSCGGSSGIALRRTGFPLSSDAPGGLREPWRNQLTGTARSKSRQI